jgi:hypothetical protein
MSFALPETGIVVAGFLLAFWLILPWAAVVRGSDVWMRTTVCLAPLLVAWKHSVVRLDRSHAKAFPLLLFLAGLLLVLGTASGRRAARALPWMCAALTIALGAWVYSDRQWFARGSRGPDDPRTILTAPLKLPGLAGVGLALRPAAADAMWSDLSRTALAPMRVPELSRTLADASVDIYPWETSHIAANALNWRPRPSFASFATYAPALDRLNASFFASTDRPRFLVWHLTSEYGGAIDGIDQRHVFWDEPAALLAIVSHYDLLSADDKLLVLEQRRSPRLQQRTFLGTSTVPWGRRLDVPPADGPLLAEITLPGRSPWATARRVLFRDEPAYIAVAFENGEAATFRFVPDQASTGLWLSPLPRDASDLAAIFSGKSASRVVAILFHGDWAAPEGPPVTIRWWGLS